VNRAGLEHVRFSEAFSESAQGLLDAARKLGLEGVIGKRVDAAYRAGRSSAWIKLKTQLRQEFVIGGYTSPKSSRAGLGALMLGFYDAGGALQYAGNVGTGFDDVTLKGLQTRLAGLTANHPAFADLPASVKGHWVKPLLVAEVAFAQWTHAGRVRHAVFQGLRTDKDARQVRRESATPMEDVVKANTQPTALPDTGKLRITHPDRVIDTSTALTKLGLVHYYAQVAPLILPHLKGRPVSLVRAPEGIGGALFFQKHAEAANIPGIKLLDPKLDPGHAPLLEIASADALLAAAQLNVLEFHTWNATARFIGKPNRMMFDLDPGGGVAWEQVQEAAQLVRGFLSELGLEAFLKTSGGKGLHLLVPIRRGADWDTVKGFSQAIVVHLAGVIPQRFVAKSGPRNRVGKIFIDYLRNGFGATTVCAWSARARPGMGVSVPVAWDELPRLRSGDHWRMANIQDRLAVGNHPWQGYDSAGGSLPRAMKTLGFKPGGNSSG
jgi:bifunctional non-homologous end joining protein LigD